MRRFTSFVVAGFSWRFVLWAMRNFGNRGFTCWLDFGCWGGFGSFGEFRYFYVCRLDACFGLGCSKEFPDTWFAAGMVCSESGY